MTYNRYIMEGVLSGTIKEREVDGVRMYMVRRPRPGEEVVGYVSFSGFLAQSTLTELADHT
jgi:hypothetical protein